MITNKHYAQIKFDALENVDLCNNLFTMQVIISKWSKLKKDNEELNQLKEALIKVTLISNKLIYEKELFYKAVSEYREDKIRAVERARRSEEELVQLKQQTQIKL